MKTEKVVLEGKALADEIVRIADERKAENIVCIDIELDSSLNSFLVICQADNTSHTQAIADHIIRSLKDQKIRPSQSEGQEEGRWILIDYFDVCVHILLPELRSYYDLESLWTKELRNRKSIETAKAKRPE